MGGNESCTANLDRLATIQAGLDHGHGGDYGEYEGSGKQYTDSTFEGTHALYWPSFLSDAGMANLYNRQVTGWARPSELEDQPSLWGSKGIQPTGVRQGQLGDCWFLAAAAAIAEKPERIERIFTNHEYSAEGVFDMTFSHMGQKVTMVVDDRLPITEGKDRRYTNFGVKSAVNARPSANGAWWVPLLEKAYSKFNQSYSNMDGGQPEQALRELTGMPVRSYDSQRQSDSDFFNVVRDADVKNYVMTANCHNKHASLITGHAYTMLGAIQLSNGVKLIRMRNPWGSEKYTGPYNDNDAVWTPALKAEVARTHGTHAWGDDGAFYLPVSDFKRAFTTYAVLLYKDDRRRGEGWHTEQFTESVTGQRHWYTFTSEVDQDLLITLDYQNNRQTAAGCRGPNVYYNMYTLTSRNGMVEGPTAVSGQTGNGMQELQVKAGTPLNFLVINWGDSGAQ